MAGAEPNAARQWQPIAAELADAGLRCGPGTTAQDRLKSLIFQIRPSALVT